MEEILCCGRERHDLLQVVQRRMEVWNNSRYDHNESELRGSDTILDEQGNADDCSPCRRLRI